MKYNIGDYVTVKTWVEMSEDLKDGKITLELDNDKGWLLKTDYDVAEFTMEMEQYCGKSYKISRIESLGEVVDYYVLEGIEEFAFAEWMIKPYEQMINLSSPRIKGYKIEVCSRCDGLGLITTVDSLRYYTTHTTYDVTTTGVDTYKEVVCPKCNGTGIELNHTGNWWSTLDGKWTCES